jgi:hypothetical protein
LRGDIDTNITHDAHGLGPDGAGMRACGVDFIKFTTLMSKKRLGDLTPGRVTRANDQYTLPVHVRPVKASYRITK